MAFLCVRLDTWNQSIGIDKMRRASCVCAKQSKAAQRNAAQHIVAVASECTMTRKWQRKQVYVSLMIATKISEKL